VNCENPNNAELPKDGSQFLLFSCFTRKKRASEVKNGWMDGENDRDDELDKIGGRR
jgi:hypothetical protein